MVFGCVCFSCGRFGCCLVGSGGFLLFVVDVLVVFAFVALWPGCWVLGFRFGFGLL